MSIKKPLEIQAAAAFDRLCKTPFLAQDAYAPSGEKTRPTGARLPESLHEKLTRISQVEDCTVNYLIVVAVKDLVDRYANYEMALDESRAAWVADFSKMNEVEQLKILLEKIEEL